MKSLQTIFEGDYQLSDLSKIAQKISDQLKRTKRFCLWLEGDLGAGKTTMTRAIFQALGLDPKIPVQSPTFMYVLEYPLKKKRYFHFDLYRIDGGDFAASLGMDFSAEDIGGMFVEWPEKDEARSLPSPTHVLKLQTLEDPNARSYQLLG